MQLISCMYHLIVLSFVVLTYYCSEELPDSPFDITDIRDGIAEAVKSARNLVNSASSHNVNRYY